MSEYFNVAEIFGEDVFNDKVMQERLPKKVYKALKKTIQEGKELDDILSDGALLQDIVSRTLHAEKTSVEFSIPKVSFEETIDISSVFGQMGIVSAFDETKADFSALSSDTGVFAGQIAESAVLDLNENIETAIGEKAYGSSSGSMYSLHLNRPFCFIIVSQNEIPLMIGAVENVMQLEE